MPFPKGYKFSLATRIRGERRDDIAHAFGISLGYVSRTVYHAHMVGAQ